MSDRIEKFISDNRKAFDDRSPSGNAWNNIETAISGRQKKQKRIWLPLVRWSLAAAAVLIIGGLVYFNFQTKPTQDKKNIAVLEKTEIPEAPQVNEFAKMILLKQEELKTLSKEQPDLYNKFTKDVIQLDSSYNALKSQLNVTPNKELLVEAMIQNLQLQLSVLNQQLSIIKQIKQEYSHEKKYQKI